MIYQPASIFYRLIAILIDQILITIASIYIYQYLFSGDIYHIQLTDKMFIYFSLLNFFYFLLLESVFKKTIGKKIFNLEIMRSDNIKPGFINILIRNIIRPIDMIGFYLLGFVFVVFTLKNQRLGDILAKTYVVRSLD